ncbi:MAG TPA: hypothetical protein PK830_09090 [Candidatus Atribacteria bacterium]|nr:hypothetical protein [Candidatus Atribacteria bacterium]HPT79240.1 hypothetical protein [Candidatus Atribacteria bacterium]
MDRLEAIKEAYDILNKVTPLRRDCGSLCNRVCCDGGVEDHGMYLFPGEEEILKDQASWLRIVSADMVMPGLHLARCTGTCPRHMRPLSCRIFPLVPYLTEENILLIKMDIRAKGICPLASEAEKRDLQPDFIRAVRKAAGILIAVPEIKDFIYSISRMLDEYSSLPWYRLVDSWR